MYERACPPPAHLRGLARSLAVCAGLACAGCDLSSASEHEVLRHGPYVPGTDEGAIQVPRPELSDGVFPCSDCHEVDLLPPNPTRRVLAGAHQEIVLHHDEEHRWCLDCHDAEDRDQLRLASGQRVPFEESYRLCGQCHGDKYRDWRAGVHGRRSGRWDGQKTYLLCVHCHDSHAPAFKPLKPEPSPTPPRRTR
jgi:hypothetical protein